VAEDTPVRQIQPITPARVTAILSRIARAHEGPWVCRFERGLGRIIIESTGAVIRFIARLDYDDGIGTHDGEFLAHAREDIPDLVVALLESQQALITAQAEIAHLRETARPDIVTTGAA
jgi:hypothetical protein